MDDKELKTGKILKERAISGSRRLGISQVDTTDSHTELGKNAVTGKMANKTDNSVKTSLENGKKKIETPNHFEKYQWSLSVIEDLKQQVEEKSTELDSFQQEKENLSDRLKEYEEQFQKFTDREKEELYKDVYEKAKSDANALYQDKIQEMSEVVDLFKTAANEQIENIQGVVAKVAFEGICRIIGQQVMNEETVIHIINKVMADIRDNFPVRIHVNQRDYELLQRQDDTLKQKIEREVELIADPRVSIGGCIVETDVGSWDGRLETQLSRIHAALSER